MSKSRHQKAPRPPAAKQRKKNQLAAVATVTELYEKAVCLAETGQHVEARNLYRTLSEAVGDGHLKTLIANDLGAMSLVEGDVDTALGAFQAALTLDSDCRAARENLALAEAAVARDSGAATTSAREVSKASDRPIRVAVVSFLFNWPSTGGGIIHTVELVHFLSRAGFEVRHFYFRFEPWEIGRVTKQPPFPSEVLDFEAIDWNVPAIQARLRDRIGRFGPDYVILTDSWNIKPLLAQAVAEFPYILRFQALECFCPLNNVRLLVEGGGKVRQCHRQQFTTPSECCGCLEERGRQSGALHRFERELSGVGTRDYHAGLLQAVERAEAVLVVNPLHEAMLGHLNPNVRVVTAGMDPARFSWPPPRRPPAPHRILFAGLVEEWMKGFHVLHDACARLWAKRQDFELAATADPPGPKDPFTRYVGWQTQEGLPGELHACDILAIPTVAQEALGRTAVEAMAAGKPVVASRIGGLPFTVVDGATGLLAAPGDAADLAQKLDRLLSDRDLRECLGKRGRERFEEHYAWPVIIERHYRPLLCQRRQRLST